MLCVDPGLLTGMSLFDIRTQDEPKLLWGGEFDVPEFNLKAEGVASSYGSNLVIVCENYIITPATAKKSQAPWSLMGRGVMQFFCLKYGCTLELQAPVDAKTITNDDLRKAGWWFKGGDGHANDSYRHGILYLKDRHRKWARIFL